VLTDRTARIRISVPIEEEAIPRAGIYRNSHRANSSSLTLGRSQLGLRLGGVTCRVKVDLTPRR
jgi:hypothetical protein